MDSRLAGLVLRAPALFSSLLDESGGGIFVLDIPQFRNDAARFADALRARYPRTKIGYSVKTNNLPCMLDAARATGLLAEVVSDAELELARLCGFSGPEIIYNGPVKPVSSIAAALRLGVQVNIDSLQELRAVRNLAETLPTAPVVGLRCHLGSELMPRSRFGFDFNEPEQAAALQEAVSSGVIVNGLHCHFPGNRGPEQYAKRVRYLAALVERHLDAGTIDFVDVGGGMAGPMSECLRERLGQPALSYEDYAEVIASELLEQFGADGPQLILEPGTALVAHVAWYVARIIDRRYVDGRHIAVADGSSLHINPFRTGFRLPVHIVRSDHEAIPGGQPVDIVGSTCMEDDLFEVGNRSDPHTGDLLLVESCGAYSMSLNSPFISGAPAVVELDAAGETGRIVRPAATPLAVFNMQGGL